LACRAQDLHAAEIATRGIVFYADSGQKFSAPTFGYFSRRLPPKATAASALGSTPFIRRRRSLRPHCRSSAPHGPAAGRVNGNEMEGARIDKVLGTTAGGYLRNAGNGCVRP
jgi:hypothetical protein